MPSAKTKKDTTRMRNSREARAAQKPKTFRQEVKESEAKRRRQKYDVTLTEHQRHLIMAPLMRMTASQRTKPEEELLNLLRRSTPK